MYNGSSAVALDGSGNLLITNRGQRTSVTAFTQPERTIGGSFSLNSTPDFFFVAFRFDGTYTGSYGETKNGLRVDFGGQYEYIRLVNAADNSTLAGSMGSSACPPTLNTAYNYKITDHGTDVKVSINGTEYVTWSGVLDGGNYVGFYNREYDSGRGECHGLFGQCYPSPPCLSLPPMRASLDYSSWALPDIVAAEIVRKAR